MIARSISESVNDDDSIDLIQFGPKLFGIPVENAESEEVLDNPEESSSYFQGDLLIPISNDSSRNGMRAESYRWKNGEVPFEIRGSFSECF